MGPQQAEATLFHLDIALLRSFSTATGTISARSVGLVSISRNGITGWGEVSPYPGQDEPFADVLAAATAATTTPTLVAGMDEAMCDLIARERGVSLSSELGSADADVPVSIAIGMGTDAPATVDRAWGRGVRRFKVKIMPGYTSHVIDIRRAYPEAIVGVDANASFDASTMPEIVSLADLDIAFVEQPTAAVDDPALDLLRDAELTVFIDESIRSAADAERALAVPAVSGVVVKPGRLGWTESVRVVHMARISGKLWRASGLLETGVGRSFTLALAAANDAFVSDVAPASLFLSYDVAPQPVVNGCLVVPTGPGTGIEVDRSLVRDRAVDVIRLSGSAIPGLD